MLETADLLVPVPLRWRRAWHRDYNQSGALARVVERQCGVKLKGELLRRVRATAQQVELSRSQRTNNEQGAFGVSADQRSEIQGRRLVLIDDVLTSGATVEGCARALLRAGAANVDVLIFARVAEPGRTSI